MKETNCAHWQSQDSAMLTSTRRTKVHQTGTAKTQLQRQIKLNRDNPETTKYSKNRFQRLYGATLIWAQKWSQLARQFFFSSKSTQNPSTLSNEQTSPSTTHIWRQTSEAILISLWDLCHARHCEHETPWIVQISIGWCSICTLCWQSWSLMLLWFGPFSFGPCFCRRLILSKIEVVPVYTTRYLLHSSQWLLRIVMCKDEVEIELNVWMWACLAPRQQFNSCRQRWYAWLSSGCLLW